MFKLRIFCNDGDTQYWEDGNETYETYHEALNMAYRDALQEVVSLMECGSVNRFFEVNEDFEITEPYKCKALNEDVVMFPVATVLYDHAPWDRENDCDIKIVTGYDIVELEHEKYNDMLKERHGDSITLLMEFDSIDDENGTVYYKANKERYGIDGLTAKDCYDSIDLEYCMF